MELKNEELNIIVGGSISGAIISSIIRATTTIFEIGKAFGSSIRRLISRRYC